MTLIIRSPDEITNPLPGSFDGPSLGVNGIVSRFVSVGAASEIGSTITILKDLIGGHDLMPSLGISKYEKVDGVPVVSLATSGSNALKSDQFSSLPKGRAIAFLGYFSANPAALEQFITTIPNAKGAVSINPNGQFSSYADGSPFLTSALPALSIAKPGWFRIVMSYGADGAAKLSVNGVVVSGTSVYTGTGVPSHIEVKASSSIGMKFADLAIIDHAVSDGEIASINAGLGEWFL